MQILSSIKNRLWRQNKPKSHYPPSVEKAIKWLHTNRVPGQGIVWVKAVGSGKGIPESHQGNTATPEVTGYIIETLYRFGEKELAYDLARWEASIQTPDGAFCAVDNVPYTFDTAQVIRGFLAVLDDVPELEDNLRRACDYVEAQIAADGNVLTPSYDTWRLPDGSMLSEYGNLYVLPPMMQAGVKLSEQKYIDAAQRGVNYFKQKPDLVEFKPELGTLSHYFGYMMEALVDLGEIDLAKKGLQQAAAIQKKDGAIPAHPGVDWVCPTGMAQLAIAWYKLGDRGPADKAVAYLEKIQNPSGGFYGCCGEGARHYFPNEEISWAVKFFLDACHWRMKGRNESS